MDNARENTTKTQNAKEMERVLVALTGGGNQPVHADPFSAASVSNRCGGPVIGFMLCKPDLSSSHAMHSSFFGEEDATLTLERSQSCGFRTPLTGAALTYPNLSSSET